MKEAEHYQLLIALTIYSLVLIRLSVHYFRIHSQQDFSVVSMG